MERLWITPYHILDMHRLSRKSNPESIGTWLGEHAHSRCKRCSADLLHVRLPRGIIVEIRIAKLRVGTHRYMLYSSDWRRFGFFWIMSTIRRTNSSCEMPLGIGGATREAARPPAGAEGHTRTHTSTHTHTHSNWRKTHYAVTCHRSSCSSKGKLPSHTSICSKHFY